MYSYRFLIGLNATAYLQCQIAHQVAPSSLSGDTIGVFGKEMPVPKIPGEPTTQLLQRFDVAFEKLVKFFNTALSQFSRQAVKVGKVTGKGALKTNAFLVKNIGTIIKLLILIIFIIVMWKAIRKNAPAVTYTINVIQDAIASIKAGKQELDEMFASLRSLLGLTEERRKRMETLPKISESEEDILKGLKRLGILDPKEVKQETEITPEELEQAMEEALELMEKQE